MKLYLITFLITILTPVAQQSWPFMNFFNVQTQEVSSFFKEQKEEFEEKLNKGYAEIQKYMKGENEQVKDNLNDNIYFSIKDERQITNERYYPTTNKDTSKSPFEDKEVLVNPDEVLTAPAIIARNSYICETHTLISQGYVLNIHRIPKSKRGGEVSKNTVLLQHGLFGSSVDWLLNGPEKALAYVLADSGYDVWMSNIRGSGYSREHIDFNTDSKRFWNFSWHEVAQYDIPAVIDYIMNVKGTDTKITYLGHSMGTTILFAMLTLRPEYNHILTAGLVLAPVVYLSNIKSPIKFLAPLTSSYTSEMLFEKREFILQNSVFEELTKPCSSYLRDTNICKNVAFYFCGFNEKQFNKTLLPMFLSHLGTGTSWKTLVHFGQEINSGGKFQQFDYGLVKNMEVYGSAEPSEYDLSKITLPISLFWSKNDLLSSEEDVNMLYKNLVTRKEMYLIPDRNFNHLDYIWAINASELLNNEVLEYLNRAFETHLEK